MNIKDTGSTESADPKTSDKELSPIQLLDVKTDALLTSFKETGKLPDNTPPELALIVRQKKMARDTQSQYTKVNQELIASNAENDTLRDLALQVEHTYTTEQSEELEDLKYSDPDAWRTRLNEYEVVARQSRELKIKEEVKTSSSKAIEALRLEQLQEFTKNTGVVINDEVIANDIPPRITKKLEDGAINFEEFLSQVARFLKADKVIDKTTINSDEPDFDKTSGYSSSDNIAGKTDFVEQYANNSLEY